MNTPIVTINGINSSAPHTVNRLGLVLQNMGHNVYHLNYPVRRWWETRSRRLQYLDALAMLRQLEEMFGGKPVDVVAHSWGNLLTARMMELGGNDVFRKVFAFAPAVDCDWIYPTRAFRQMWVVFNRKDRAIWAAEYLFLGQHPWGNMGRVGYRGEDKRIHNREDLSERRRWSDLMHSHYFENGFIQQWAQFVSDQSSLPVPA